MKTLKAAIGIGHRASQRKQAGVATILVILMIGVGLVAVSVGTMHTMRNSQERQLVAHAQVNAQAGAWAAVEAVRQFLGTLTKDQLTGIVQNHKWEIATTGVNDGLNRSAIITKVVAPTGTDTDYKITAEVSALATAGQSSSTIEVVYSVTPAMGDGSMQLSGVLDFYNDLKTTGGITLNAPSGQGLDFNVDGDFSSTSAGISGTGFRNISVTGNVYLDSQVAASVIRGRNIKLVQSAKAITAEAWGIPEGEEGSTGDVNSKKGFTCCGKIDIETWAQPAVINAKANGDIKSQAGEVTNILSRRNVTIAGKGSDTVRALGNIEITNWTDKATDVLAGGNFLLSAGVGGSATLRGFGKVDCPAGNGNAAAPTHTIRAKIAANLNPNCRGTVDSSITPPIISKVEKVTLKQPVIDAWALKGAANYAIEFTADKKLAVKVRNVNGIADGDYFLGRYGKAQWHLCKSVDATNQCVTTGTLATPKDQAMPFCINNGENTECFTADPTTKTLDIKADSTPAAMPAGVIWFDGDLKLAGGPFYNTFIATKNITTYGSVRVYSVNYGSDYLINGTSDAICKNQRGASTFAAYTARYPTNFCDSTLTFKPMPLGNIGMLAGGYSQSQPSQFVGGKIALGNDTKIYGTVVAGDILETSGATTVYGYVTAAGLKNVADAQNTLTASITIDLTKNPANYTPDKIPDTSNGGGGGATAESIVLWTRYL